MVHYELKFYFLGLPGFPRVTMDLQMPQRWSSHHRCGSWVGYEFRLLAEVLELRITNILRHPPSTVGAWV